MTRSGCSRLRAAASPRYAASFVSGFSRIVHVLKTTTSASSALGASPSPSSSSRPLIRSESWAFIWHPNVVTWYRRTPDRLARAGIGFEVARDLAQLAIQGAVALGEQLQPRNVARLRRGCEVAQDVALLDGERAQALRRE